MDHRLRPGERRLAELQLWAVSEGAASWMADVEAYEPCRVVGVVERLVLDPVDGTIEATVTDGTDWIIARWRIRRPTPQLSVVPGKGIRLEGVPIRGDGQFILAEPAFQVIPFPAVA